MDGGDIGFCQAQGVLHAPQLQQLCAYPLAQLGGGRLRIGDRHDPLWGNLARLNPLAKPLLDCKGLAGTGTGGHDA